MLKKTSIRYIFLSLCGAALLGLILQTLSYLLPTDKIKHNVAQSFDTLSSEGIVTVWNENITGSYIDNFTTALMFNIASFSGPQSLKEKVLLNPRVEYENQSKIQDLAVSLTDNPTVFNHITFWGRYWHGYLIFLKPLLIFCDYTQLRFLNFLGQSILFLLVCYALYTQLGCAHLLTFIATILYINPITIGYTLNYSSVYDITLISMLLILYFPTLRQWKTFLWIGISTAFFDLLTYPLITLGFPLVLYLNLSTKKFKQELPNIISLICSWGIGYLIFWSLKWIITTLLTSEDVITDGINTTLYRMHGIGATEAFFAEWNFISAIKVNMMHFYNKSSLFILITYLIALGLIALKRRHILTLAKGTQICLLLSVALLPFGWYIAVINHSLIHSLFTHRILSISFFALGSALSCILYPVSAKNPLPNQN
jgi:hypothetical protein